MPASTVCSEAACLQSRLLVLWQAGGKMSIEKKVFCSQRIVIIKHNHLEVLVLKIMTWF
jgi:hypothetical protein